MELQCRVCNMARKKSIWLSKKVEWIYYIAYIVLSISIRKTLFYLEPIPYFRIFFPIILGTWILFAGIKSIRKRKAGFHSITYFGKDAKILGIIAIIIALIIMLFVK